MANVVMKQTKHPVSEAYNVIRTVKGICFGTMYSGNAAKVSH
jgi:hypothetical protein